MTSITFSRRELAGIAATGALALAATRLIPGATRAAAQDTPTGPFTLPDLAYDVAALEPHIDALTMEIHHGRHHLAYVTNLNKAVDGKTDLQAMTAEALIAQLDAVPEEIRGAVRNNAGGHVNHSMYWEIMAPGGNAEAGELGAAIDAEFGGLDALKEQINAAGTGRFGSGWAWLVVKDGKLAVLSTPNQDNPLMDGSGSPVLGVDVWEHAYYLQYQNKRADYLAAWWNVVNWSKLNERYLAALASA